MSFFNDAQRDGLLTGRYICSECGGLMEFVKTSGKIL